MKNIHLLPTDKPSNGYILGKCIKELSDVKIGQFTKTYYLMFDEEYFQPHNIYITSDEEIKKGDYGLDFHKEVRKFRTEKFKSKYDKKIIMTTDQDLIKDGVQAIDDEFLEWFVKNPSCEEVEVFRHIREVGYDSLGNSYVHSDYKIIIPKEEVLLQSSIDGEPIWGEAKQELPKTEIDWSKFPKATQEKVGYIEPKQDRTCNNNCSVVCGECQIFKPKQETLEEAAERLHPDNGFEDDLYCDEGKYFREAWLEGAKWQQERMYSEEEVLNFTQTIIQQYKFGNTNIEQLDLLKETLEKFKNK